MTKSTAARKRQRERKKLKKVGKVVNKVAKVAKVAKAIKAIKEVKGHGDYVPNRFARVKGHGGYFGDLLSGIGSGVGGIIDTGANLVKNITGMGDYRERVAKHNLAVKGSTNGMDSVTNWQSMNMGACNVQFAGGSVPRVRHREFIGNVYGSAAFKTTVYRIQPGLRGTGVLFPWASSVANCFEQYKLLGMIMEYNTKCTNYAASTTLGSVMMSTQYNASDAPLSTELAIKNHEFTTGEVPSNSFIHPIELDSKESAIQIRYVNSSNTPSLVGAEELWNDVGIFQVSTIGTADGLLIGELWATYEIEFLKPNLPDIHAGTSAVIYCDNLAQGDLFVPTTRLRYNQQNSLPAIVLSNRVIQLPVGYAGAFTITTYYSTNNIGSATLTPPYVLSFGSDITAYKGLMDYQGSFTNSASVYTLGTAGSSLIFHDLTNSGTGSVLMSQFTFSTIAETAANNTITFSTPTIPVAGGGAFQVIINAVDSDIPSGIYGPSPPTTNSLFGRKNIEQHMSDAEHSIKFLSAQLELEKTKQLMFESKLSRLEALLTGRTTPVLIEECKDEEATLSDSIHIPRSTFAKLLTSSLVNVP